MTIRTRLTAALAPVLLTAALVGCSTAGTTASSAAAPVVAVQSAEQVMAANVTAHTADTGSDGASDIVLSGDSVTITEAGVYRLTGTVADGQVVVTAPDADVTLVLDGVDITSSSGAAIAATEVGSLVVVLAEGSTNTLSDARSYAEDADVNAALFSAGDLTVAGSGSLTVHGNGNDGIASKDGLVVLGGAITVDAVDDGVRGKDYVVVSGGTVDITAGGDGIKADNTEDASAGYVSVSGGTVDITAAGDGVDAATDLVVVDGVLTVVSGGGHGVKPADDVSGKGLKSGVITVLAGGKSTVDSSDDAVHSDGTVHVQGGALVAASGDDGVHAEDTLAVGGGTVDVTSSVEGLEAAQVAVSGGEVSVVASDDGVNAAGGTGEQTFGGPGGEEVGDFSAVVSGGTLVIDAGGDGFDSNGTASITGGTVVVNGPTNNGNGALDVNGDFSVSGGVLLAAGSAGMVVSPGAGSSQGWVSATLPSAVPSGTTVQVVGSDGTLVATFVTSKAVGNVVYSSSAVVAGQQYEIRVGGIASGVAVGGLAESGDLGSAAVVTTVTAGQAAAGGQMPGRR